MKKKRIRASELWAVIISFAVLSVVAIILPGIARCRLKMIAECVDKAIKNSDNISAINMNINEAQEQLNSCDELLHFLYPHTSITELESTMCSVLLISERVEDEKSQVISELCRLKGEVDMLLESVF